MMDFKELKIGYVPYSADLSQPADRRRFPYFAKRNNVAFEIADKNKFYDVVLLPAPSNLSQWLLYKEKHPKTRFIFEMVDSLIFSSDAFNTLFRGTGRFLQKKESQLYPDYKKLLFKWLKIADVVICSSNELKSIIEKWNDNVIVSLDYLQNEARFLKEEYQIKDKLKLVWEGQSGVLPHFLHFKEVFREVNSFCELHIITDEKYPAYGNMIFKDVTKILHQLPITTQFHKWEIFYNYKELSKYDCGIIPLNKKNAFGWHKPANKLISFWFTGLPTLVSNTPAYTEMMNDAGENLYCSTNEEWIAKIHQVKNMKAAERSTLAKKNLKYVNKNFSDEALDLVWFKALRRLSDL
jgi:glycosyltransferase involved in cell wall biosynthesis